MSPPDASTAQTKQDSPPTPTVAQALLVLLAVVIAIAGYLALGAVLGIREAYIGFVFVFYWLSIEQGKVQRLPAIIVGSCFGLAAAWLLQFALHSPHIAVLVALFLAAVALSIVCLVLGRLPVVFNTPAMLVLTVFTIPHIQQAASFPWVYGALAFAAVYFGLLVVGLTKLAGRPKPRQQG